MAQLATNDRQRATPFSRESMHVALPLVGGASDTTLALECHGCKDMRALPLTWSALCFSRRQGSSSLSEDNMTKTVIALLTAGALVASCGRNEPDYEDVADRALDGAGLQAAEADYDADAKVIHVTGTVASEADRQRAGDVVSAAVGSGAQVANEVTVQGGHEETANDFDDAIETRLNNVVQLDAALKESSITFDAAEGIVTITGRVPTAAMKDRVGTLARAEAGVRDVVNSLEVGPKS